MSNQRKNFERLIMSQKNFILNIPQYVKMKLISKYVSYMDCEEEHEIDIVKGDLVAFQATDYGNSIEVGEVLEIKENKNNHILDVTIKIILPSTEHIYEANLSCTVSPSYIWCYFQPID